MPRIVLELFAFLSAQSLQSILEKKLEQLVPGLLEMLRQKPKTQHREDDLDERDTVQQARMNFQNYINFEVYEQFFRMFCRNQYLEYDYTLRADLNSLKEGMKWWYGGKPNDLMAELIFNYIGKGKVNHLITFNEFLYFVREVQLSRMHQNVIIFHFVSDNQPTIRLQNLLRIFVMSPQNSAFANELKIILDFYRDKILVPSREARKEVIYD